MGIDIICSDAVQWARDYDGPLFHALLCDPPYHLQSIVKRFGDKNSAPAQFGKDGVYARSSRGFMGKQWDGGDVSFHPDTWEAFMKVLHPGAFGMAFASSRGWHRLACAIEDAGFIIHPSIFGWVYSTGFPKATRVKADGFDGHRYGLQALKPALEPIIVFQKPYEGRPIDNIVATGAGALNIDGARIGTDEILGRPQADQHFFDGLANNEWNDNSTGKGRWPANFILLNDAAADALDKQSGIQSGGFVRNRTDGARVFNNNGNDTGYHTDEIINEPDAGASRFFFRVQEKIDTADPVYYEAKASGDERDAGAKGFPLQDGMKWTGGKYPDGTPRPPYSAHNSHPTVKPISLACYLATLLLPPTEYQPRNLFVPFAGVASECIGAMQAGWDEITGVELTEEYIPIAKARVEYWKNQGWQTSLFEESR